MTLNGLKQSLATFFLFLVWKTPGFTFFFFEDFPKSPVECLMKHDSDKTAVETWVIS